MYPEVILNWIRQLNDEDGHFPSTATKIEVNGAMSKIEFYVARQHAWFKVFGSPYLLAMVKWLQQGVDQGRMSQFYCYDINRLIHEFELPRTKRYEAMMIIELIEKLER
ncbi:MAG: hypothetical protein ACO2ZM_04285 [Francisellaceae bacterium]